MSRQWRILLSSAFVALLLFGGAGWWSLTSVRVVATVPVQNGAPVAVTAPIVVTLSAPPVGDVALSLDPPAAGAVEIDGQRVIFRPNPPLQPQTTYRVSLAAGLADDEGRSLRRTYTWSLTTRTPRIVFVGWDNGERQQLFVTEPGGGPPQQITTHDNDIIDFSIAPDGNRIAYTVRSADGGSDLWWVGIYSGAPPTPLLACPDAICRRPAWSNDGQRLIYERTDDMAPDTEAVRLWWLAVPADADREPETVPVFTDETLTGMHARLSPDNEWLSFSSPLHDDMLLYRFDTQESILLHNHLRTPATWHPDSSALVTNEFVFQGEQFGVHILHIAVPTGDVTVLSQGVTIDDGLPSWSPDGAWLAFGRKKPRAPMGRQLWLMRPNGSDGRQLTEDNEINHGAIHWSPDSQALLYQRFDLYEPDSQPSIYVYDVGDGTHERIAARGIFPQWLP
jgi:TolB protein